MNDLQNLWHRLTVPRATDEDEARREYMTKVILVILSVIGLAFGISFFIGVVVGALPPQSLISATLIPLFLIGGWWLTDRGYWRFTSHIPLIVFFSLALLNNYMDGVGTLAMLQYAIVILLATILQGGRIQWIALALSIGAYLTIGWMHVRGVLPLTPVPESVFVAFSIPVSGMLILIAVLQWFYTSQFRRTMAELVEHKITLEQHVEERTVELQESMLEREQLQQHIIEAQQQALKELSTPIIPVMDAPGGAGSIIVMPLIGSIDSARARDIMRALLTGIREHRARTVILDITGVPLVDSGVASHLNKAIQAARLKGAYTIITGISDALAEMIVDLGIDWSGIKTVSDLQTGLRAALAKMGMRIEG